MILIFLSAVILLLYLILIVIFVYGWNRNYKYEPKGNEHATLFISVIVACKNEENNIEHLISYIAQQSYQNFELIIVNDHSTDSTKSKAGKAIKPFQNMMLIDAARKGKKNAIKEGVTKSKGRLIVTIDADCFPTFHWLESIACFQERMPTDLIICPVKIAESKNFYYRVQGLEFVSLVASGAGAAGAKMPILCNAANMAFTRDTWQKAQKDLRFDEQSGDDIFLLQSVKKRKGVIRFLKSEAALVNTEPALTLKAFLNQRRRWASKAPGYTDWQLIFVAVLVLIMAVFEIILFVNAFDDLLILAAFGGFFVFKFLIDILFLSIVQQFFHLKTIWAESLFLSVIYPFYIVFVSFSSLIFRPQKWK